MGESVFPMTCFPVASYTPAVKTVILEKSDFTVPLMASGVPCMIFGMASFPEILKKSAGAYSSGKTSVTASFVCSVGSGVDTIAAAPVIAVP